MDLDPETRAILVQNTRDQHPTLPPDLAHAYLAAIEKAEAIGGPRWHERADDPDGSSQPRHWRRHVAYLRDVGWRDADIAFAVRALRADNLIYELERDEAREALCALEKQAPASWLDRTQLRLSEGDLGFRAAHTLAWWSSLDVDAILRPPRS